MASQTDWPLAGTRSRPALYNSMLFSLSINQSVQDSLSKFSRSFLKNYNETSLALFASKDEMNGDARITDSIRSTIVQSNEPRSFVFCKECSYIFKRGAPRRTTITLSLFTLWSIVSFNVVAPTIVVTLLPTAANRTQWSFYLDRVSWRAKPDC
jgi:hypothetical protein